MAGNDTEEKNNPPTDTRLDYLRDKEGQVAKSTDFPTALTLAALCGLLVFQTARIFAHIEGSFVQISETIANPLKVNASTQILALLESIATVVWPFMAVAGLLHILVSALSTKGIVISGKNISPNFGRLNPVNGLKKIFGLESLSKFLKTIVRIIFVGTALYWIFVTFVNSIFWAPPCGASCILQSYQQVIGYTVFTILLISIIVAIVDIWIAGALFRKQNKMSDSEIRREYRENNGSPEVIQERYRLQGEATESNDEDIATDDTLLLNADGGANKEVFYVLSMTTAVGVEYVQGSRKPPVVVSIMSRVDHDDDGTKYVLDPLLANDIAKTIAVGAPINSRHYTTIAKIMMKLDVR